MTKYGSRKQSSHMLICCRYFQFFSDMVKRQTVSFFSWTTLLSYFDFLFLTNATSLKFTFKIYIC
ncbi:hypothetical protein HanRHA438_Chr16g0742721 [Helianthus annuus]|nr:hypothetical protein HanIR_Chr16g0794201 [Helianthus annuus]KAJ0834353.1 hypothetical protein HanRHA438_Chr16g0742721 [Helianthus annuus]